ncbi:DUF4350 domain-containing protein [Arthrobacter jiangjiafuii]|uniref:DUF4350 domain-containing protein n=1 Tax=Arthrobacter jiangjiafuii TaxID=2817475 RepID=A0A975M3P2_9MICC|nr:DUF4350 domain-containing protein [Arthrobacter jiangjiafuii]MBP3044591.1 DUF4350 domain-containing protein [Arthrobacter jiangjiafuii]QWC09307.1 DUF4350 domain-containing protein [Arthrobacter jiangjiafuii]
MTAPAPAPASARPAARNAPSGSFRATLRARLRAWRLWIVLGLVLCLVVVLGLLRGTGDNTALSPVNPAPAGSMAAAEILAEQGVEVLVPSSHAEARSLLTGRGEDATLLLVDPSGYLGPSQLEELNGQARRQVLVEPSFEQLAALAPGIRAAGVMPDDGADAALSPGCDAPDALAAENIDGGGLAYRAPLTCFTASGGDSGVYAADGTGGVVVLGNAGLLANESLASRGNAALTLRTLGSTGTLIWYLPTVSDIPAGQGPVDPQSLLPQWVDPVLLWLLVVALLAAFWRGRRLGPLAAEPLPVVVRSAETAEGRARLYQDSRATERAAATFRAATLTRLASRLRVGPQSTADMVVRAAAAATGRRQADVEALLNGPLPATNAALVNWSQDLQALEEEVTAS